MSLAVSVLLATVLLALGTADAADRFISPRGNDQNGANACLSAVAPCRTLGNALAQGGSGDVIKAAKGTYKENVTIVGGTWTIMGGYDAATFSDATRDVAKNRSEFSGGKGGAFLTTLSFGGPVSLTLDGLSITGSVGQAPTFGGGIVVDALGGIVDLILSRVTLAKNRALFGGGLSLRAGDGATISVHVTHSLFQKNKALAGGAISVSGFGAGTAEVTVEDSLFSGNTAEGQGGAADIQSNTAGGGFTTLAVRRSIFDKNKAGTSSAGGAISMIADDDPSQNGSGGGAGTSSLILENSILQGNTAAFGSAVSLQTNVNGAAAGGSATISAELVNNTITANKKAFSAIDVLALNFIGSGSSTVTAELQNNIVHGNGVLGVNTHVQDAESFVSLALTTNNVEGVSSTVISPAVDGVNSIVTADPDPQLDVDPGLVKTAGIYRLGATSPMIDAGTCDGGPADDFEGDVRPTGTGLCGVDIGADEF
jgi:hypothetical protein